MIKTQCEQCKKYNTSCTEDIVFNGQSCDQYSKKINLDKKNDDSECNAAITTETTNVSNANCHNILDNDKIIDCIQEIGKHTKFLSIMGYILLAIMILGIIGMFEDGDTGEAIGSLLALVGVYFIVNNLWKASKLYRNIATDKTIENLESGVKRMTVFWKTMAVLYKVYLVIIAIAVFAAIISI